MNLFEQVVDDVLAWVFPLSALLLFLYPFALLAWTAAEGRAAKTSKASETVEEPSHGELDKMDGKATRGASDTLTPMKTRSVWGTGLLKRLCVGAGLGSVGVATGAAGFVACSSGASAADAKGAAPQGNTKSRSLSREATPTAVPTFSLLGYSTQAGSTVAAICAGLLMSLRSADSRIRSTQKLATTSTVNSSKRRSLRRRPGSSAGRTTQRSVPESDESLTDLRSNVAKVPKIHFAPPASDISLWHDVDLEVKSWLDETTGLFRYINEMPLGTLQKFEVQPGLAHNAIAEDPKGSSRLQAFGRPVPFNYGCFPQTYRDPDQVDELHGAPGDDDPLDVLDLGDHEVKVGAIVKCRPLGAVCLIDEGKADWKILAVNVEAPGLLAKARSVEEVERLMPGRIQECLQWIDDFKRSAGAGDQATLHFEVHDANCAIKLMREDNASWRKLVAEVGPDGMARGHWICDPRSARAGRVSPRLGTPAALMRTAYKRPVHSQTALSAPQTAAKILLRAQSSGSTFSIQGDNAIPEEEDYQY